MKKPAKMTGFTLFILISLTLLSSHTHAQTTITVDGNISDWTEDMRLDVAPDNVIQTFDDDPSQRPENPLNDDPEFFVDLDHRALYATNDADYLYIRVSMNPAADVRRIDSGSDSFRQDWYAGNTNLRIFFSIDPDPEDNFRDNTGNRWGWWHNGYDYMLRLYPFESEWYQGTHGVQNTIREHTQVGDGFSFPVYPDEDGLRSRGAHQVWSEDYNELEMAISLEHLLNPINLPDYEPGSHIAIMLVSDSQYLKDDGDGGSTTANWEKRSVAGSSNRGYIYQLQEEVIDEPDTFEQDLTGGPGYRLLSAPTETSLQDLLAPIWTQGATGSDDENAAKNVWTWDNSSTGNSANNWTGVSDLNTILTPGTGILVYVFMDDDPYDNNSGDSFPKTLSVTGMENPDGVLTPINENEEGWTLLGNPFAAPTLFGGLTRPGNLDEVIYVWDVNESSGDGGDQSGQTGSWRTWSQSGESGDISDGIIAPFQGFFVLTETAGSGDVTFSHEARTTGGAFYGKEAHSAERIRMELEGEDLRNSAWISFRDHGSLAGKVRGDAYQLTSLSREYAQLAVRKGDGLFDISILPNPDTRFELPLNVQATRGGSYTLRVTDFEFSSFEELYLEDRVAQITVPLNGELIYEFTLDVPSARKSNSASASESIEGPAIAAYDEAGERFYITTNSSLSSEHDLTNIPTTVDLAQNYPNPFNPTTQISFSIPEQMEVRLEVYDMLGRQISVLVDENQTHAPGRYSVTWDASSLSSGVYIYRLEAGGQAISRRMTLVK